MSNEYSPGKTIFMLFISLGVIALLVWAIISVITAPKLSESPNPNPAGVVQSPSQQFERPDDYIDLQQSEPVEAPQSKSMEMDDESYMLFNRLALMLASREPSEPKQKEQFTPLKLTFN